MGSKKPDALKALEVARQQAIDRAKELEESFPPEQSLDYTAEECLIQLIIAMYATGLKLGMGVMPDGMAIFIRISVPSNSVDPRAGMVSFVVHNDPTEVFRKAILALEASPQSNYWKPDQYAAQRTAK